MRAACTRESRMTILGAACATLMACATWPDSGETREYRCVDGLTLRTEVTEVWVRIHTATGTVELTRARSDDDGAFYTNGVRSMILEADGSARHAIGRNAWAECKQI